METIFLKDVTIGMVVQDILDNEVFLATMFRLVRIDAEGFHFEKLSKNRTLYHPSADGTYVFKDEGNIWYVPSENNQTQTQ